jgi:hypothetical protein
VQFGRPRRSRPKTASDHRRHRVVSACWRAGLSGSRLLAEVPFGRLSERSATGLSCSSRARHGRTDTNPVRRERDERSESPSLAALEPAASWRRSAEFPRVLRCCHLAGLVGPGQRWSLAPSRATPKTPLTRPGLSDDPQLWRADMRRSPSRSRSTVRTSATCFSVVRCRMPCRRPRHPQGPVRQRRRSAAQAFRPAFTYPSASTIFPFRTCMRLTPRSGSLPGRPTRRLPPARTTR